MTQLYAASSEKKDPVIFDKIMIMTIGGMQNNVTYRLDINQGINNFLLKIFWDHSIFRIISRFIRFDKNFVKAKEYA